jgi:hypothetical protein
MDPARRTAMRVAGIERASVQFDIREHARGVEAFFRDVLYDSLAR